MFDKQFGFRAGNHGIRADLKPERIEFGFTGKVANRFMSSGPFDQIVQCIQSFFGDGFVESCVQFDTFHFQDVAEQQFGIQARRFDALFGVIFGNPVQQALYSPILHFQIIAGAKKSEKQKGTTESASGLKLGLFLLRQGATTG